MFALCNAGKARQRLCLRQNGKLHAGDDSSGGRCTGHCERKDKIRRGIKREAGLTNRVFKQWAFCVSKQLDGRKAWGGLEFAWLTACSRLKLPLRERGELGSFILPEGSTRILHVEILSVRATHRLTKRQPIWMGLDWFYSYTQQSQCSWRFFIPANLIGAYMHFSVAFTFALRKSLALSLLSVISCWFYIRLKGQNEPPTNEHSFAGSLARDKPLFSVCLSLNSNWVACCAEHPAQQRYSGCGGSGKLCNWVTPLYVMVRRYRCTRCGCQRLPLLSLICLRTATGFFDDIRL